MRGFKTVCSAAGFCAASEAQRQYFRARRATGERVALAEQRRLCREQWVGVLQGVRAG